MGCNPGLGKIAAARTSRLDFLGSIENLEHTLGDLPRFTLVTGNRDKQLEAARILGFRPPIEDLDLPEIQELDLRKVLQAKGEEAWRRLQRSVVVEETGLGLDAMGGFPGPLVKWMLGAVGAPGIARIAHALGREEAVAQTALWFHDGRRTVVVDAQVRGTLLHTARGDQGFGWDPIFVPDGQSRSYAELEPEEKDRIGHRGKAWRKLLQALKTKEN